MELIFGILGFLIIVYGYKVYNFEKEKLEGLRSFEVQILLLTLHFIKYKEHMLKMLEIVHEKAGETDEQFIKDYEKIKLTIEEKVELFGERWVTELKNTLGYETEYKNWKDVTKYIDGLVQKLQNDGGSNGDNP